MPIVQNATQILEDLKAGNARFLEGTSNKCSHSSLQKIKDLGKGSISGTA